MRSGKTFDLSDDKIGLLKMKLLFLVLASMIVATLAPFGSIGLMEANAVQTKSRKEATKSDESAEKTDAKTETEQKPVTETWAQIELSGSYSEGPKLPGLFGDITENLEDLKDRLDRAANDKNVKGVLLKINPTAMGWGTLHELQTDIHKFKKASGKPVAAWIESGTLGSYLLATTADTVYMPESGYLLMTGLRAEVSFYKNMFDYLDIQPDFMKMGDFKSAAEPYTRTSMSEPFKLEMNEMLDSIYGQIVKIISKSRKMKADEVKAAIDEGPFTANTALSLKLIDKLAYLDELPDQFKGDRENVTVKITPKYGKKKIDTDFDGFTGMMKMMNLLMGVEPSRRRTFGPKIAVIYAIGPIMSGKSVDDPFAGKVMGSDTIVKAIETANESSTVKAIVLRVDSPGGSALASDVMWRALEKVDKPFVVSMGNVAASGGYYISMGADEIFAEPGTITGSIGVVSGKFALEGLYKKIGIDTEILSRGQNSGFWSSTTPMTDSERKAMRVLMEDIYDQFTSKAAKGRKMKHDKLKSLAGGRIYTGEVAVKNGLVDKIGTLDDAVKRAQQLAGLDKDAKVERVLLPKPPSPFEALFGDINISLQNQSRISLVKQLEEVSPGIAAQLKSVTLMNKMTKEPRLLLMPFRLNIQ